MWGIVIYSSFLTSLYLMEDTRSVWAIAYSRNATFQILLSGAWVVM